MAPKKAESTPHPASVDTNPYGAFVNLRVDAAKLEFTAPPDVSTTAPKTHLSITYSPDWAPLTSEPFEGSGSCAFGFTPAFRWGATHEAMLNLINARVTLSLVDSVANCVLGSAELDMLQFALGASEFGLNELVIAPAASVPEAAVYQLVSGSLPLVHVSLTHREGAPPGSATDPPPEVSEVQTLPEPIPFCFIPDDEVKGCNVLELAVSGVRATPAALHAVCAAAKDGKSSGKMAFSLGLQVVEGLSIVLPSGALLGGAAPSKGTSAEGNVVFEPARIRQWVSRSSIQKIQYRIEEGLPMQIELARYLTHDSLADPAWEYYHAAGWLKGVPALKLPGATSFSEDATLEAFQTSNVASILPEYQIPAGKAKAIEEPPAAAADGSVACAWQEAGTILSISLSFAHPIFLPWRPPRKPKHTLLELLPACTIPAHDPPTNAVTSFTELVSNMAATLSTMAASHSGGADRRAQALVSELRRNGKDLALQSALRKASVDVARERYKKPHNAGVGADAAAGAVPTPKEKVDMHNDLFTFLTDQMNSALVGVGILPGEVAAAALPAVTSSTSDQAPDTSSVPDPAVKELARLSALAGECEAQGLFSRAEMLHQRRLIISNRASASVWVDYGCMLMRAAGEVAAGMGTGGSGLGRAEECFRSALALDRSNVDAMLALAAVVLHQGRFTDPLLLAVSEATVKELLALLVKADSRRALAWALLRLIYRARGDSAAADAEVTVTELLKLEEELSAEPPAVANGLFAISKLLLDLGLPALSMEALRMSTELLPSSSGQLVYEAALLRARGHSMLDDPEVSTAALQQAASMAPPADLEPAILAGHIHFRTANYTDAVHAYYDAMLKSEEVNPSGCPLRMYLQMAQAYMHLRHMDYALDVYVQACAHLPNCASAWLGVALSRIELKEFPEAELALAEANLKDPEHPLVWGNMALVALRTQQYDEAATALKCAMRFGLTEAKLTSSLASEYVQLEQFQPAVALLRASLAEANTFEGQAALIGVLLQAGNCDKASAQIDAARQLQMTEQQQQLLGELTATLESKLGV